MSQLTGLQQAIIGRLTAVDATVPAPVPAHGTVQWITENIGDLGNIIQRTIGKLGIIGIVMTPGGGKLFNPGVFPIAFRCAIEIQTQENVTINRGASGTQIASLDLVEFVMKRLHLWSFHGPPVVHPRGQRADRLQLDEVPYLLVSEYPVLTYNVRFSAPLTIQQPPNS
jgi:hypothetical protein